MTDREAMKLALEALEHWMRIDTVEDMHIFETVTAPEAIAVLRQALEQLEQVSVPEGWKLVPIEPTDAMLSVPVNIDLRECVTPGGVTGLDAVGLFRAWEAMIEAAPQPWDTTDMGHRAGGLSMEQEPVYAFRRKGLDDFCTCDKRRYDELASKPDLFEVAVFYTAPPKREWVELTFEEADRLASKYSSGFRSDHNDALHLVGDVEALLKEKNI